MHPAIVAFLDHLKGERNASPHTLRSYQDDLAVFAQFLAEVQGEGADPTAADAKRLRRYSAWLSGTPAVAVSAYERVSNRGRALARS